jgi:hypothetical protein
MPGYHALRLPEQYQALLQLSSADFAWEWLRRNIQYCALWAGVPASVRRFEQSAITAARRIGAPTTTLGQHPLVRRSTHFGITFPGRTNHSRD